MLTHKPPKLSATLTYADAKTTAEAKCTPAGSLKLTLAPPKLSTALTYANAAQRPRLTWPAPRPRSRSSCTAARLRLLTAVQRSRAQSASRIASRFTPRIAPRLAPRFAPRVASRFAPRVTPRMASRIASRFAPRTTPSPHSYDTRPRITASPLPPPRPHRPRLAFAPAFARRRRRRRLPHCRRPAVALPPRRRGVAAGSPSHCHRLAAASLPLSRGISAAAPAHRCSAPSPPCVPARRRRRHHLVGAQRPLRSRVVRAPAPSTPPLAALRRPHTRPALALPRSSRRLATAPLLRCSRFAVPPRPRSPEGQGPRRAVGPPLRAAAASPSRDGRGPARCGRRGRPTAGQLQRHRRLALAVSPACAAAAWPSPRRRAPRRLPVAAARRAAAPFLPPRVRAQRRRLNTTPLRPRRRLAIALRQRRRLAAALRVRRHPHFTVAPLRRRRRSGATSVNGSGRRSRLDSCLLISTPELAIPDLATPVLAIPSSRDRDHATLAATRNSTTTRSRGHTAPCLGPRGNPGARPWLLPWLLATSAALPRPPGQPWRPALACATTSSDHCATHRCLAPARASSVPSRIATRQREPRSDFSTVLSPRRSTPHLRPWRLTPRPLAPADAIARPVSQRPIAPCAPVHPPRYRQHGHSPRKPPPRAHPTPTRPCDAAGLDSRSWLALSVRVLGWHSRLAFSTRALDPHSRFAQRQRRP